MNAMGCGVNKLKDLFKELRDAGYARRIPIRNENGDFIGSKREFASSPIFLSKKPNETEVPMEGLKNGPSETMERPEIKRSFNNTSFVNNTISKTTTNTDHSDTNQAVVVINITDDERRKLTSDLVKVGVDPSTAHMLVQNYSPLTINKAIKNLQSQTIPIKSPGGWVRRAIEKDYPLEDKQAESRKAIEAQSKALLEQISERQAQHEAQRENGPSPVAQAAIEQVRQIARTIRLQA
jgi:hypothetical protein